MATLSRHDLQKYILTKSECVKISDETHSKQHAVLYTMDLIFEKLNDVLEQKELKSANRKLRKAKNGNDQAA